MRQLQLTGSKHSIRKLASAQKAVDRFLKRHPGQLSNRGHVKLRKLLSNRARALSAASRMKVHSLFD